MTNSRNKGRQIWGSQYSGTANTDFFFSINMISSGSTEADSETRLHSNAIIKRVHAYVTTNSKNVTSPAGIRADSVDVGTHISITNGTTGLFDSGAMNNTIASGADVCFEIDMSPSASGTMLIRIMAEVI